MDFVFFIPPPPFFEGTRAEFDTTLENCWYGRVVLLFRIRVKTDKKDSHFQFSGAPKMTPWMNFRYAIMLWPTSQMLHTPAQFVGHGRMLNVFFGSSQTEHWLPGYGHFKFRGIEAFQN
jgi:hypothetical protein